MNKLQKIGALGGVLALIACWPAVVGKVGEEALRQGVKTLQVNGVQTEVLNYQRGYLSSQMISQFTVVDPKLVAELTRDGLPKQWTITSDISHGLFGLTSQSHLSDHPDVPVNLTTHTQLNGNTQFELDIEQWNYQNDIKGVAFSLQPSQISGSLTVLGGLTYLANVPSIQMTFANGDALKLDDIQGQGDGKQAHGYFVGEQTWSIEHSQLTDITNDGLANMQKARYHMVTSFDETEEKLTSVADLSIDHLASLGIDPIDALKLRFAINDIDRQALDKTRQLVDRSGEVTSAQLQQLLPALDRLFAKGFEIDLQTLSFGVADGEVSAQGVITIPASDVQITKNPFNVLQGVSGQFDSHVTDEVAESYPSLHQTLDELVVMEMVTTEQDQYRFKADLEKGKLILSNGKEIPLLAILVPMLE